MYLSIELPVWAWVAGLLIEQLIFIAVVKAIKERTTRAIAQMHAEMILRAAIQARASQMANKAGWSKTSKNEFKVDESE